MGRSRRPAAARAPVSPRPKRRGTVSGGPAPSRPVAASTGGARDHSRRESHHISEPEKPDAQQRAERHDPAHADGAHPRAALRRGALRGCGRRPRRPRGGPGDHGRAADRGGQRGGDPRARARAVRPRRHVVRRDDRDRGRARRAGARRGALAHRLRPRRAGRRADPRARGDARAVHRGRGEPPGRPRGAARSHRRGGHLPGDGRAGGWRGGGRAGALAGRGSVWDQLPTLAMPTLVLWGAADAIMPVSLGERLAAALPEGRLRVLDGSGHLPPIEQPGETAAIVGEWLDAEVRPTATAPAASPAR